MFSLFQDMPGNFGSPWPCAVATSLKPMEKGWKMFMDIHEGKAYLQAYKAIRQALRQRLWPEGQHVSVARCAEACSYSPTPVREAMARLAGEGLLDERRGLGYFVPRLGPVELSELYTVTQGIAISLVNEPVVHPGTIARADGGFQLDSGAILLALAGQRANSLLCLIAANLDARLAPVRQAEATMFDLAAEAIQFLALLEKPDHRPLQRFVNSYYNRRRKVALEIARRHDSSARPATV